MAFLKPFANGDASYAFDDWNFGTGIGGDSNHWGWNASVTNIGWGLGYGRTY